MLAAGKHSVCLCLRPALLCLRTVFDECHAWLPLFGNLCLPWCLRRRFPYTVFACLRRPETRALLVMKSDGAINAQDKVIEPDGVALLVPVHDGALDALLVSWRIFYRSLPLLEVVGRLFGRSSWPFSRGPGCGTLVADRNAWRKVPAGKRVSKYQPRHLGVSWIFRT